jgi:aldehyde:ferredoxin oxidoreductase
VISDYEALLDEYYEACGWDVETGVPSEKKLQELGLEDYK